MAQSPLLITPVTDNDGGTASSTLDIVITPVNDAPIAVNDSYTVNEDESIALNPLKGDSDIDGDTLSIININGTALTPGVAQSITVDNGVVKIDINGAITFTPEANFNGQVEFDYTISDGKGGTDTATETITVTAVNDAPIAVNDSYTVVEDGSVILTPLNGDSDIDGDTLSITSINGESMPVLGTAKDITVDNGMISVDTAGVITFTPNANFNGSVSFPYTISDGKGGTDTATETITVTAVNDAPIAVNDSYTVAEDGSVILTPLKGDSDIDGDTLSITSINGTALTGAAQVISVPNGSVSIDSNGGISFTPEANFNGQVEFDYTISDGKGGTDTATETITVTAVNDAPIAKPDSNRVAEEVTATGNVLDNDTDIDSSTLNVSAASVDVDGSGTQVAITLGSATTISANGSAIGVLTLNSDGSYSFVPAADFNGTVPTVDYTVTDNDGGTASSTLDIVITPVNDAPIAVNDSYTVNEDESIALNPLKGDSDIDGDTLSIININGTALTPGVAQSITVDNGVVKIDINGAITFTPEANFNGQVEFDYTISDGKGGTDTATETITVTAVNDAPIAVNDSYTVVEDGSVILTPLNGDSDIDGDTLSITSINGESMPVLGTAKDITVDNGMISVDTAGVITFTPNANFNGSVSFPYTISDGKGGTDTATETITVTAVNDAPIAVNDNSNGISGQPTTINVISNDADLESNIDPKTVKLIDSLGNEVTSLVVKGEGTWTVNVTTGAVTFTPVSNFNSDPTPVKYVVSDTGGLKSNQATITLDYPNLNPNANPDSKTLTEDLGSYNVTGNVLTNDNLGNTPTQDLTWGSETANYGSVTKNADGSYSYTLNNASANVQALAKDQEVTEVFTYTITDQDGQTSTSSLTITITGTNDRPVITNGAKPAAGVIDSKQIVEQTDKISITQSGMINFTDVDTTDILTLNYVKAKNQFSYGSGNTLTSLTNAQKTALENIFSVTKTDNSSGNWNINASSTALDFIPVGQSVTIRYAVQVNDGKGITTVANGNELSSSSVRYVEVTITGTNDNPILVNDTARIQEDNLLAANLFSNDTNDIDFGEKLTVESYSINGTSYLVTVTTGSNTAKDVTIDTVKIGSIVINSDGSYTFTPVANFSGKFLRSQYKYQTA